MKVVDIRDNGGHVTGHAILLELAGVGIEPERAGLATRKVIELSRGHHVREMTVRPNQILVIVEREEDPGGFGIGLETAIKDAMGDVDKALFAPGPEPL